MGRTWAIIERELRRFRRSPMLIMVSLVFPIVQLVVLGYAFGFFATLQIIGNSGGYGDRTIGNCCRST